LIPVAGGASDTETAMVQGVVRFEPNIYGVEIVLYLFSMNFIPDTSGQDILGAAAADTLDASGNFSIDSVGPGSYRILAVETSTQYNAFIGPFIVDSAGTTVDLDTVTLGRPGSIAGHVVSTDPDTCLDVMTFIKGSPFGTVSDSTGYFLLNGIPAGPAGLSYKKLFKPCTRGDTVTADPAVYTYDSLLEVRPQDTVFITNILE